jgi:AP-1 complex subunit mu
MCGISAIYILDKKGRVLISRHFRSDLPSNIYDIFNKKTLEFDDYTLKYSTHISIDQ